MNTLGYLIAGGLFGIWTRDTMVAIFGLCKGGEENLRLAKRQADLILYHVTEDGRVSLRIGQYLRFLDNLHTILFVFGWVGKQLIRLTIWIFEELTGRSYMWEPRYPLGVYLEGIPIDQILVAVSVGRIFEELASEEEQRAYLTGKPRCIIGKNSEVGKSPVRRIDILEKIIRAYARMTYNAYLAEKGRKGASRKTALYQLWVRFYTIRRAIKSAERTDSADILSDLRSSFETLITEISTLSETDLLAYDPIGMGTGLLWHF
jgi:hypothetical protein